MSAEEAEVAGPGRGMTGNEILAEAAELIEHGIPVFPIALSKLETKVQKRPINQNGHNGATLDIEDFKRQARWGKENSLRDGEELGLGAVLGAVGGILGDYDTKNGAQGGEQLEQHRAQYGDVIDRVTYWSISGAINVAFKSPDPGRKIGNTSPWEDVDIRADAGWFVPPGVFCSWGEWAWRSGDWGDLDENAQMPAGMFGKLLAASETESRPAADAEVNAWLDENRYALPSQLQDKQLEKFAADIGAARNRNPALKEALDWVKRQNEGIDRRAAFELIDAAWRRRMAADGESTRLNDAWDVLGRVVGYDNAWRKEREQKALQATAPPGMDIEGDQTIAEAIRAQIVTTSGLASIPMPDPIVDGYFFRDSLAWIIGASGAGKSFLGVDIAMKVGTGGGMWAGRNVKGGRVLYVAAEGGAGLNMRTRAWRQFYGATEEPEVYWIPRAINLFDPQWADGFAEAVTDAGYDMIILDTLARSTVGAEENSAKDMGEMIQNLDRIRIASGGACVVVVHHTGKDAERGGRGSTALKGALESEVTVTGSIGEILYVQSTKQKNVEELPKVGFKAQKVGLGGIGLDGEELSSVVIVPATSEELDEAGSGADSESNGASEANLFQRNAVRSTLKRLNRPSSMNLIHGELKARDITVGKATLAGILEKLCLEGFAIETAGPNRARQFTLTVEGLGTLDQ